MKLSIPTTPISKNHYWADGILGLKYCKFNRSLKKAYRLPKYQDFDRKTQELRRVMRSTFFPVKHHNIIEEDVTTKNTFLIINSIINIKHSKYFFRP